jgi:hypothetical protein
MDALVALNRTGELRSTGTYKGFVVHGRRVPGLSACLHRCAHYKTTRGNRSISLFAPGEGSGLRLLRSNTRAGVSVHDKIRRTLSADAPRAAAAPRTYVDACAMAARAFCVANGLRPCASELVIAHPTLSLATRFDALLRRADDSLELLSWKTGCGPSTQAELAQHEAQVAMEHRMLEAGHGVRVDHVTLLYIGVQQRIATGRMCPVFHGFELGRKRCAAVAAEAERHLAGTLKRRRAQKKARP